MLTYWKVCGIINVALAFALAMRGDSFWFFSFGMAAFCGYMYECVKEKQNNER